MLGWPPFREGGEAGALYRILHGPPDLAGCPEPLHGLIARWQQPSVIGATSPRRWTWPKIAQ
jgi:hypothetical protein